MTDLIQPKPGILDIAPYVGGKSRIEGVAEPMKLSSNENALGAGEKARAAYEAAIRNLAIYPDGRASKLREAVAAHHGLEPERLIFGNGSDEVFALLNQTYLTPGDNIVTGQYGFLAYRISARANQAEVKLAPEPNYKAEVDALLEQVDDRTRIVYISSPSNPTGSYNTAEEVRALHAGLPENVLLVIDEAYAEFVTASDWETSLPLARDASNVIVTRTFSKIHGLAGLRIGFGYEVLPSAGNFVLVRFSGENKGAAQANEFLHTKGIIVRPVGGYGLTDHLRITIGTEDQNRAVIDALSEFAAL